MLQFSVPPGYRRRERPVSKKLGPHIAWIDGILESDRSVHAKQRHTAQRIFERLQAEEGYTGGYTIVREYVASATLRRREMFVPLSHRPGHAQPNRSPSPGPSRPPKLSGPSCIRRTGMPSIMSWPSSKQEIGRASIGDAAKRGYEVGSIGWVSFDHYAARPTVEIVREDAQGQPVTELLTLTGTQGRAPGDMQMHPHVAVFNIVETPSGRVGSINLALLEGRIHEWGALYQAYLANHLRVHGVVVEIDARTEMAKLSAVPDSVVAQFSKRTMGGTAAARAYARSLGLDWETLTPDRKIALLKAGVQNPREAKSDDVSDLAAWRATALRLGYEHRSVLRPNEVSPVPSREQRLETAFQAALPLLGRQFDRRAVIDGAEAWIAAAKGLIAAGIGEAGDVDTITQAFRERGVRRRGEDAALIWGACAGAPGQGAGGGDHDARSS